MCYTIREVGVRRDDVVADEAEFIQARNWSDIGVSVLIDH
jgi:hypothetical protein